MRLLWAGLTFIAYILALLSKEHVILLPAVLAAMAVLLSPKGMSWRRMRIPALVVAMFIIGAVMIKASVIGRPYE
ncbi:hypothetical protein NL529_32750, partial [Klebsiella pneumoniae]|nr:hypothetical protein [Klebsiella pneumoniae]